MADSNEGAVTALLAAAGNGSADAFEQLWRLVYDELHVIAARQLGGKVERRHIRPTSLVHEAFCRLQPGKLRFANRRHFFAAAAQAMRRIRVDYARKRKSQRRGGGEHHLPLHDHLVIQDNQIDEILAVDEALSRLEEFDSRKAEVVKLRYFAGFTIEETAELLGKSARSVNSDWQFARVWLFHHLHDGDSVFG